MDRRQQKTREAIFDAFSDLLMQKSYGKITVQEIIDAANVGRTTFYAHFETKDDLLREICAEMFDHVVSHHSQSERSHDFSESEETPWEMLTHVLYHLRDNRKYIVSLLRSESGELFLAHFKQYLHTIFAEQMKDCSLRTDMPEDFLMNHVCESFIDMVHWWIQHDMQQSPEVLIQYYSAVIAPIL